MYVQRLRQMMTEVYKAYHNIGPIYGKPFFCKTVPFYSTRCIKPLEQLSFNTVTYGCNSFMCQNVKEWHLLRSLLNS